jgi:hypothetical protein
MTWAKYGVEFFDQCAEAGLSDAAVRTHVEALHYLYRLEAMDMRLVKHLVRRFAGSADWEQATKELVAAEFWHDVGDAYVVVHHEDVFRQSLAAQLKKREVEKERQRRNRAKDSAARPDESARGPDEPAVGGPVGTNVGDGVGTNVRPTQTDRQSFNQPRSEQLPTNAQEHEFCTNCGEWLGATYIKLGRTTHPVCSSGAKS